MLLLPLPPPPLLQTEVLHRRISQLKPPPSEGSLASFLEARGLLLSQDGSEDEAARSLRAFLVSIVDRLEALASAHASGDRPLLPPLLESAAAAFDTLADLMSAHSASSPALQAELSRGLIVMLPTLVPLETLGEQSSVSLASHVARVMAAAGSAGAPLSDGSGGAPSASPAAAPPAAPGAGTTVQPGVPVLLSDVAELLTQWWHAVSSLGGGRAEA